MDISKFDLEELLLTAIKSEVDSNKLYSKMAKKTKNGLLKDKLLWAADYSLTFWSATSDDYQDNMVISSGFEWLPDRGDYQHYLSRISYRIGARYESGYLVLNHHPVRTYAATIGVGLPFKNVKNRFNLTFEIGRQGTLKHSLILENYYRFSLHVNLQEIWFRKYKYD